MWTKSSDSQENLIAWTFDEAPAAHEPAWPDQTPPAIDGALEPRPPRGQRRDTNGSWLLLAALAVLAVALNAVWPQLEAWRTRRAIETVIARQEQALIAGDQAGLRASFKQPGGTWAGDQLHRLQFGWQPAAFGLPGARSDGQPGTIVSYQVLAPQLVRADVARTYLLADGTRAAFALPQYYQFAAGAWQQAPAPPSPADDLQTISTARAYVHYNQADAGLAASTASELDTLLARACAHWNCPPDLSVAVIFGLPEPMLTQASAATRSVSGCLTFQMLVAQEMRLPDLAVKLPTHDWAGYPVGDAANNAVRRSVAVQALANVAERLAGSTPGITGPIRPFLYALVVRELVRLDIEPLKQCGTQTSGQIVDSGQLWSVSDLGPDTQPALLDALALLNRLMVGRSPVDEQHLLHALGHASDPVQWFEVGLGLTQPQAQAAWYSLTSSRRQR